MVVVVRWVRWDGRDVLNIYIPHLVYLSDGSWDLVGGRILIMCIWLMGGLVCFAFMVWDLGFW